MDGVAVRIMLTLIVPGTFAVFGLAFVGAWRIERKRAYLLHLAAACALFAIGACMQILQWPSDAGLNALGSCAAYTAAVLFAASGLLAQSGQRLGYVQALVAAVAILGLTAYFYYVDRNLLARIYVMNVGFGLILLATAWRLRTLWHARRIDRALLVILLVFSIQFIVRTVMTVGLDVPPGGARSFGQTTFWQMLQLSLAVLGASLVMVILSVAVTDVIDGLRQERDTDKLTGVLNRRGFDERAKAILEAGVTVPVSLLLCDLDYFKRINDRYGHDVGDRALQLYGQLLMRAATGDVLVGRIGGEEFALLYQARSHAEILRCADALQSALEDMAFNAGGETIALTASIGIAHYRAGETYSSMMKRADTALYAAKDSGRNQIVVLGDTVTEG